MIARIGTDFIPVALKAGTVMNPPAGIEGDLYRELRRTQPAPQGICAMNSAGKVLAWSLMFEDDASVLGFLDHTKARFAKSQDAGEPVVAERFMRFPGQKLPDLPDSGRTAAIPAHHAAAERCPSDLPRQPGSLLATVVGRALDSDGNPVSDARTQDNYIEDRFEITATLQRELMTYSSAAKGARFRVPHALARALVANAYLGMLDVNPLGGEPSGGQTALEKIDLWALQTEDSGIRLWGTSEAAGEPSDRGKQDGRQWTHTITLTWQGRLEMRQHTITRLTILAEGREKLHWGNRNSPGAAANPVASLPAGKPIDLDGRVRYGIRAE